MVRRAYADSSVGPRPRDVAMRPPRVRSGAPLRFPSCGVRHGPARPRLKAFGTPWCHRILSVASIVLPDGEERRLEGKTVRLGRDPVNELTLLGDPKISRSHAELRDRDGQWILVDLGSSNGTKVNDRRIEQHPLRDGDRIQLGRTTILFTAEEDPNPTETDARARAKAPDLSERERRILALVAGGLTDRQIGEHLFISASTVRSHLDRIGKKTGLRRRAELTRLAVELGIVA